MITACYTKIRKPLYQTPQLKIERVSPNTYQHISYLETETFGKVACNGMIVATGGEAIVFDTPVHDRESEALIDWVEQTLKCKVIGVVVTHFHEDCLGGLRAFHRYNIPSYAHDSTLVFASRHNSPVPQNGFESVRVLPVGEKSVHLQYFGAGHTIDNIVGYFPADKVLFGGCLIKADGADEGYLGDANTGEWPKTVKRVKEKFPEVKIVIPGHGNCGGKALLDYTIELFEKK